MQQLIPSQQRSNDWSTYLGHDGRGELKGFQVRTGEPLREWQASLSMVLPTLGACEDASGQKVQCQVRTSTDKEMINVDKGEMEIGRQNSSNPSVEICQGVWGVDKPGLGN